MEKKKMHEKINETRVTLKKQWKISAVTENVTWTPGSRCRQRRRQLALASRSDPPSEPSGSGPRGVPVSDGAVRDAAEAATEKKYG